MAGWERELSQRPLITHSAASQWGRIPAVHFFLNQRAKQVFFFFFFHLQPQSFNKAVEARIKPTELSDVKAKTRPEQKVFLVLNLTELSNFTQAKSLEGRALLPKK